jgi:hypothetical protein
VRSIQGRGVSPPWEENQQEVCMMSTKVCVCVCVCVCVGVCVWECAFVFVGVYALFLFFFFLVFSSPLLSSRLVSSRSCKGS